ncbi:MAG: hypothetical protein IPG04_03180 [Polyangiaceae bacterium]|nr:hypothetical protein [Polyangiaceae bacterium]
MGSFQARVAELVEACGDALISPASKARLAALAGQIEATVPEVAVECHLGRGADAVDLTARVFPEQRDRMLRDPSLPARVRHFFSGWAEPGSELGLIPFVELEWDHHRQGGEPWIGPAIEPNVRGGIQAIEDARQGLGVASWPCARAASALIARLGQREPAWHARLLGCFEALPRFGCINHLSLLEIRGDGRAPGFRTIGAIPGPELGRYLDAVGWRGDHPTFERLLARYAPFAGAVALDLDVHLDHAAPRVAFYVEHRAPRESSSALRELLSKLEADGLAPDGAAEALRRWVVTCTGRPGRALTFKVLCEGGAARVKVYFGSLETVP